MAILDTVKKIIPYIKEATGYVLCHISSQAVEMDDGTLLQDKIESMDGVTSNIQNQINTLNSNLSGLNGNLGGKIVYAKATADIKTYSFYMFPVPNNGHLRAFIASYTTDDVFYRSYDVAKIENDNFYLNNADGFEPGTTAQVIAFFD